MTNIFIGDDLTDIITVNRPGNTANITITKSVLTVGDLLFVQDNPIFPYTVTIDRTKSKQLNYQNSIYLAIYYPNENGNTVVKRTCLGTLILMANGQVVPDVEV